MHEQLRQTSIDAEVVEAGKRFGERTGKIIDRVKNEQGDKLKEKGQRLLSLMKKQINQGADDSELDGWLKKAQKLITDNFQDETKKLVRAQVSSALAIAAQIRP